MEYRDFNCEYEQMPNNMIQCPYMRYLHRMNSYQCPFTENFRDEEPFDYELPFLMPRIIGVDIDELF